MKSIFSSASVRPRPVSSTANNKYTTSSVLPSDSVDIRLLRSETACGSVACSRTGMNLILCNGSVSGRSLEADNMILMRFPVSRSSLRVNLIAFVRRFTRTMIAVSSILLPRN